MKHLSRAVALLIALLTVVFILPRVMPIPYALEEFGFYPDSSLENTAAWSNLPLQYADTSECNDCHGKKYRAWNESAHRSVSCENCHGPAKAHIDTRQHLDIDTSRESCGLCHNRIIARPKNFPQIDFAKHGGQSACSDCHNPHSPRVTTGATLPRIPHTIEVRSACLSCHQIGSIKAFPQNHRERSQDTCLSCHKTG